MIGKLCKIKGCKNILKKVDGRICQMHRSRWFRHKTYNISPNWTMLKKGQPQLTQYGYFRIYINGKRMLQHVYIMEEHLKRKLKKNERVHHINHIRTDNRIENLKLMSNHAEHIHKYHPNIWKQRKINNISIDWSKYNIPKKRIARNSIKSKCIITECNNQAEKRTLCLKHYQSYYKNYLH